MSRNASEVELAEHFASALDKLGEQLRQQLQLTKQDLFREIKQQIRMTTAWAVAAAFGFAALLMFLVVGIALWTYVFPFWAGALLMGLLCLLVTGAATLIGIHGARRLSAESVRQNFGEELEALREIEHGIKLAAGRDSDL